MAVHDEWWQCLKLRHRVRKVWDLQGSRQAPPALSICAAIDDMEHVEELTPEAFKAEYERLERILSEAEAQKMMEIGELRKG